MRLLLLISLFFIAACSSKHVTSNESLEKLKTPFSVQVKDDYYDGKTLYVNCQSSALSPKENKLVLISLKGLQGNEVVNQKLFNLVDLPVPEFTVALDAENLTDYQLKVIWGAVAEQVYSDYYQQNLKTLLELESASASKVKRCSKSKLAGQVNSQSDDSTDNITCKTLYKIRFSLKNNSQITLPAVKVDFELLDIFEQAHFTETVDLLSVNLKPEEAREFKFIIVEPAELADLQLKPNIRLQ